MTVGTSAAALQLAAFVVDADPPADARERAAAALLDTAGVALAGAPEPAARIARDVVAGEGGACTMIGVARRTHAAAAALANGTAAHALDFDDMCFVSLAHPSAPLVPAALAAAEMTSRSGRALLDAYVVGFEIQARLGRAMNPRHYQTGWHCTSTLGSISAAAAASRLLGLDSLRTSRALAIAASEACGLKENFGTMVKPLHAGLAARNGILAALLAKSGMDASERAIDGPQGYLAAFASERASLSDIADDLGSRWEIVDTGITVKLYPSCAGTHPAIDAVLELRRRHGFAAADVDTVDVSVDAITPTVLIYDTPASGLEGKFSMRFCIAAALADGGVTIGSFEETRLSDAALRLLMERVSMHVDRELDPAAPRLTQARVSIALRDGRVLTQIANGARGYPDRPASPEELDAKFLACARRTLPEPRAVDALRMLRSIDAVDDVRRLTATLTA